MMLNHITRNGVQGSVVAMVGDDAVVFWTASQVTPDLVPVHWVYREHDIDMTEDGMYVVRQYSITCESLNAAKKQIDHIRYDRAMYLMERG